MKKAKACTNVGVFRVNGACTSSSVLRRSHSCTPPPFPLPKVPEGTNKDAVERENKKGPLGSRDVQEAVFSLSRD